MAKMCVLVKHHGDPKQIKIPVTAQFCCLLREVIESWGLSHKTKP